MNTDKNNSREENLKRNHKDNNPTSPDRKEINPANKNWEASRNPDSDNDRKGRNVDMDREDRKNEMSGREQQTTPKGSAEEIVDRFNKREEQNQDRDRK